MPILDSALLDKTLTFDTYEGVRHKNLRFLSILDAQTVIALGFDAPAKHMQNYPYLPAGVPDTYSGYKYAKFMDANNDITYLGIPWVKPDSVTEVGVTTTRIIVRNADQPTLDSLRSMMIAHGIDDFTFESLTE